MSNFFADFALHKCTGTWWTATKIKGMINLRFLPFHVKLLKLTLQVSCLALHTIHPNRKYYKQQLRVTMVEYIFVIRRVAEYVLGLQIYEVKKSHHESILIFETTYFNDFSTPYHIPAMQTSSTICSNTCLTNFTRNSLSFSYFF